MNSLYGISQNGYPKEIINKGDTVVVFTYSQLKEINSEIEASQGKDTIIDSLNSLVLNYETLIREGSSLNYNLKSQITEKDKQLFYSDQITLELTKQLKKQKLKTTWGIVGGIGGGIVTGFIIGFLTNK